MIVNINSFEFVNGIRKIKKKKGKINNYDCNNLIIPNLGNIIIKSAICYLPGNESDADVGGHYIIWQRYNTENKWIRISDSFGKSYQNLVNNLANVTLLILEKL